MPTEQVHMIWLEANQYVIKLMTDPFGNYLCQKLLEFRTLPCSRMLSKSGSQPRAISTTHNSDSTNQPRLTSQYQKTHIFTVFPNKTYEGFTNIGSGHPGGH
jgi:hypothetical protein